MATATITGKLLNPDRTPQVGATVRAFPFPTTSPFFAADSSSIVTVAQTTTASDGTWSLSLERTDTATPSGMTYEVVFFPNVITGSALNAQPTPQYITVPAGGGTFESLLITNPPPPVTLANATVTSLTATGDVIGEMLDKGGFVANPKAFGAQGTSVIVSDAAITSGQAILTSATANFPASSVGQTAHVVGAGASGAQLSSVILSWQSVTQVTLSNNAGTTVTSAEMAYGPTASAAFLAAIATGAPLQLSGGTYNLAGWTGWNAGTYYVYVAGSESVTLILPAGVAFMAPSGEVSGGRVGDFSTWGGFGAFHSTYTGVNSADPFRFERIKALFYTGAAFSENSSNWPYLEIISLLAAGANFSTTMGIALSGDLSGGVIRDCDLTQNRVGIKMRPGRANPRIDHVTFVRASTANPDPRIDIWLVPDAGDPGQPLGLSVGGGTKFGNENLLSTDYRILVAAETSSGGDNAGSFPNMSATYTTECVNGIQLDGIDWGNIASGSPPLIYSMGPRCNAWDIGGIVIDGGIPPYLHYNALAPLAGDDLASTSIVRGPIVNNILGIRGASVPQMQISNDPGWAVVHDTSGQLQDAGNFAYERSGGSDASEFVPIALGPISGWSTSLATVTPITDDVGGTNACEVDITSAGGSLNTSIANLVIGKPTWFEFSFRQGSSNPINANFTIYGQWQRFTVPQLALCTDGAITSGQAVLTSASAAWAPSVVGATVRVTGAGAAGGLLTTTVLSWQSPTQVTLSANAGTTVSGATFTFTVWKRFRFLFYPRTGSGTAIFWNGDDGSSTGRFQVARPNIYQAREPQALDSAQILSTRAVSTSQSVLLTDNTLFATGGSGGITLTLPAGTSYPGKIWTVKKVDSGAGVITVKSASGTLDGVAAGTGLTITNQYSVLQIQCDGTNFDVIGQKGT